MEIPILLVSDGLFHPSLPARRVLERFLRGLPGSAVLRARSLEALPRIDRAGIRAVVLYYHHKTISPAALDALEQYAQSGGGVVAVHSASASFKQSARYRDLLGGRFLRHGPVREINLRPCAESVLFAGIPPFPLRDELYRHEVTPDITAHFFVEVDGEREPFVWSRSCGAGRVLYLAPGHTVSALRSPHLQEILRRGLAWVSREEGG